MWFSRAGTAGLPHHGEAYGHQRADIYEKLAPKTLLVLAVGATLSACMPHTDINDRNCSSAPTMDALPYLLDVKDTYISINRDYIVNIDKKPLFFCRKKINNADIYTMISEKYKIYISYEAHIGKSKLKEILSDKSFQPDIGDILVNIHPIKSGNDSLITVTTEIFSR